mmetsp:Transcript_3398/g.13515  ORF Transcript_3398/g.13515 Transcript_3398/m.13515 type:complete len:224 (+) Transcript_3398:854-1525(+)
MRGAQRVHDPDGRRPSPAAAVVPHQPRLRRGLARPPSRHAPHRGERRRRAARGQDHAQRAKPGRGNRGPRVRGRVLPLLAPNLPEPNRVRKQRVNHAGHVSGASHGPRLVVRNLQRVRRLTHRPGGVVVGGNRVGTERDPVAVAGERAGLDLGVPKRRGSAAPAPLAHPRSLKRPVLLEREPEPAEDVPGQRHPERRGIAGHRHAGSVARTLGRGLLRRPPGE